MWPGSKRDGLLPGTSKGVRLGDCQGCREGPPDSTAATTVWRGSQLLAHGRTVSALKGLPTGAHDTTDSISRLTFRVVFNEGLNRGINVRFSLRWSQNIAS